MKKGMGRGKGKEERGKRGVTSGVKLDAGGITFCLYVFI